MKSVKTLTRFSNELARQSVIALDQALKDRLVADVAATLDSQFFGPTGDGVTMPKGLFVYAGQSMTAVGALTPDTLLDAEALALGGNVNTDALKWVLTSREFIALGKIKTVASGSNQYVLIPDPSKAGAFQLFGHPVIVTNRVVDTTGTPDTANMALVDFSQIVVARDLAPSILGRGEDPSVLTLANAHLPIVTSMVRAYTRGAGFAAAGEPADDLAASSCPRAPGTCPTRQGCSPRPSARSASGTGVQRLDPAGVGDPAPVPASSRL